MIDAESLKEAYEKADQLDMDDWDQESETIDQIDELNDDGDTIASWDTRLGPSRFEKIEDEAEGMAQKIKIRDATEALTIRVLSEEEAAQMAETDRVPMVRDENGLFMAWVERSEQLRGAQAIRTTHQFSYIVYDEAVRRSGSDPEDQRGRG